MTYDKIEAIRLKTGISKRDFSKLLGIVEGTYQGYKTRGIVDNKPVAKLAWLIGHDLNLITVLGGMKL